MEFVNNSINRPSGSVKYFNEEDVVKYRHSTSRISNWSNKTTMDMGNNRKITLDSKCEKSCLENALNNCALYNWDDFVFGSSEVNVHLEIKVGDGEKDFRYTPDGVSSRNRDLLIDFQSQFTFHDQGDLIHTIIDHLDGKKLLLIFAMPANKSFHYIVANASDSFFGNCK